MTEKVSCVICQKQMTYINNRHLSSHGITAKEYHEKYPDHPLMTEKVAARLSERSVKSNASRKGVARSEQDLAAIREGISKRPSRVGIKMGPMSDEQKIKISETKKAMYADGTLICPTKGITLSDERKKAISESLKGRKGTEESKRKRRETHRANHDKGLHKSTKGRTLPQETRNKIGLKTTERYKRERAARREHMFEKIKVSNLKLLNAIDSDYFELECLKCGYQFKRRPMCFQPSKFHTDHCDQCFPISKRSLAEIELHDFVQSLIPNTRIISSDVELIAPRELDILIPDFKFAIEYCGLYWHSEIMGKDRWYHYYKFKNCTEKGIRLITIFEDEWINNRPIVESMIRNALGLAVRKLDARKCTISKIESNIANDFLKQNHIQGRGRSNARYGLFYQNELVSVMTFSDSNISRKLEGWEINRFCSALGYSVRGGASRLFAAFIKDYAPETVVSFADLRWGEGKIYEKLGFERVVGKKLENTVPNYWYFQPKQMKRFHRYALRKNENDPVDQSEWEIRQQQGWNRIWDCGHAKWVWKVPTPNIACQQDTEALDFFVFSQHHRLNE